MPSPQISPGNSAAALSAHAFPSTESSGINPRVIAASVAVVAIHVGLLVVALTLRNEPPSRPIKSKTITAELISLAPPQPVAAPAAIQSTPVPPPPKPVPPKPVPKPKPVIQPRLKAAPTPLPETTAPSPVAAAALEPAPAPPTPPGAAAPAAAAPAIGRPTMALDAPKDVAHLECNIAMPDYPALSRRRGESGAALVKFVVGLTGKIENIELKKSSGSSRLDDAALDAMRSSACKPYKENGVAIRAAYSQPFVFGLND
ncbi:energy transducer TonB [Caballeronia sp. SEWSISQ10-4 2]|uniref:energy transducer TonB n=1 Tax=Caballeronia sp. SEWSISQ10-4 2 TaxID=2937438 RepID=UPI002654DD24|nr:energy transducer TonB [Caballeronia sp. SEWSISQ10-4 2]MDN7182932.1 energy transducer TonB [Caballeronia sp. SEWSISQ10-4 2]